MITIHWKKLKRTMLFIDASNIYYSQRTLGWQIDYQIVKTKEVKWIKTGQYDTALLFSGDSDFAPAVAYVQTKQKQVIQRKNHPALKRGKYSNPILLPTQKAVKPKTHA